MIVTEVLQVEVRPAESWAVNWTWVTPMGYTPEASAPFLLNELTMVTVLLSVAVAARTPVVTV